MPSQPWQLYQGEYALEKLWTLHGKYVPLLPFCHVWHPSGWGASKSASSSMYVHPYAMRAQVIPVYFLICFWLVFFVVKSRWSGFLQRGHTDLEKRKKAKWLWWVLHGSRHKLSVHVCAEFTIYAVWCTSHVALYANSVCCVLFRSTWSMGLCPRSPVRIETHARPVRGPWSWSLRPLADWLESPFMRYPSELWWRAVSIVYKSWLYGWDVTMRHYNL